MRHLGEEAREMGTHRFEGGQGSYTSRVRPGNLERRELQGQSRDYRVNIALGRTDGFWQTEVRENEKAAGLIPHALVSQGLLSCLCLCSFDKPCRWQSRRGVGRPSCFPTWDADGGRGLLGGLTSWLPVGASRGGLCSLCSSLLLLKFATFGFGPVRKM